MSQVNDIIALKLSYLTDYIKDTLEKNNLNEEEIDHFTALFKVVMEVDNKSNKELGI